MNGGPNAPTTADYAKVAADTATRGLARVEHQLEELTRLIVELKRMIIQDRGD